MRMRSFVMVVALGLRRVRCAFKTAGVKESSSSTEYCALLVGTYETSSDDVDLTHGNCGAVRTWLAKARPHLPLLTVSCGYLSSYGCTR